MGLNFIAASFIKSREDVKHIKKIINDKNSPMQIIANNEHLKAVENLEEILEVSDAIMVTRSDLGLKFLHPMFQSFRKG